MAAPTAISVYTDAVDYSRYERGRETITATVTISGAAPYVLEEVVVELIKARRQRDAVVATVNLSFSSNTDPQQGEAVFDLRDIVDQDLINLVRHGRYFVRATSVTDEDVTADSDDFDVSIVTVERLKSDFLYGIDLSATEIKAPKFQPAQVAVEITELSKTHPLGFSTLTYNYHEDHTANATYAIGAGANGTVTITANEDNSGIYGNDFTVTVQIPAAANSALSASVSGNSLVVNLAKAGGVLDTPSNTATLIAAAITALDGFTAVASGSGASSIAVASGPSQFTGGTTSKVRLVSWRGGKSIPIQATGTYLLPAGSAGMAAKLGFENTKDYITIRVRSLLALPTGPVAEEILIDKKRMDDESLRRFLVESVDWVENVFLNTPVEPMNVVTDRDPTTIQYSAGVNAPVPIYTDTDFDKLVSPLTYYVPNSGGDWVTIQTPWPQILRVDALFGSIANTRVIDVDLEWIELSQQGGLIQLVPYAQNVSFDFLGLIWANALRGAAALPNFWHYNAIVGLRDCPAELQEVIAKKAAINALIVAGMALRPGVGSVSLSRDGVSESVSYVQSAQYGVYTGTIMAYTDWLKQETARLQAKYRGIRMVIV